MGRKGLVDRDLKVSGRLVGFYFHVRRNLSPCKGRKKPPTPQSVYKVLKDERPSRALLTNIFENCPALLKHPATSENVKQMYREWKRNGHRLPDEYGQQSGAGEQRRTLVWASRARLAEGVADLPERWLRDFAKRQPEDVRTFDGHGDAYRVYRVAAVLEALEEGRYMGRRTER